MESDYMDENSRPGAVIGPKSVPRYTNKLLEQGTITEDDCFFIHAHTVEKVYGVPIRLA
jgi:TatD-related deoxyribonuclease